MGSRNYSSPLREAEAERTRAAILAAAASLFARDGYAATTMRSIAAEAGVSVPSVHLAGPKSALLIGAFEESFAGDEGQHSLAERSEIAAIMADSDISSAVGRWLDFVAEANRRTAALARALVTAAETDSSAAAAVADLDGRRRRDMALAAQWFVDRGVVPVVWSTELADELGLITGPEVYAYLVQRTGWQHTRYREWLGVQVDALLGRLGSVRR